MTLPPLNSDEPRKSENRQVTIVQTMQLATIGIFGRNGSLTSGIQNEDSLTSSVYTLLLKSLQRRKRSVCVLPHDRVAGLLLQLANVAHGGRNC